MTEAPNWMKGQGLSWSGMWHFVAVRRPNPLSRLDRARCGANVFGIDTLPQASRRLQMISSGKAHAKVCQKCSEPAQEIPYDWGRVKCPTCNAKPYTRCRALSSGRKTDAHKARYLAAGSDER